ncbi:MAG: cytochrome c biogenesis protein DipZ [Candidatus Dormibacteria bacterium]|jgi:cytochrome c biogenesis protein CcdA/thiol-disulfide isomerase/thioredoxin
MISLLVVGFVAGLITGISPCILPVLPVVLVAGATGTAPASRRRRSVAVVAGLVASFSVITLVGTTVLSAIGLPQDLLRDAGLLVLGLFGIGLLVPAIGEILERPFFRLRGPQPTTARGGLVLGLGLGAVFVPCAGPVLAAITVIGATNHLSFTGLLLTVAFAAGAGVPLLAVALAGDAVIDRVRALRDRARGMRIAGGAVLIVMTLAIGLNLTNGLQQDVTGYTNALQNSVEGGRTVRTQLQTLTKGNTGDGSLLSCTDSATLENCGPAPDFAGITAWLNTPGGAPLSLPDLRGKVVLIDFWTYSCINCQRTIPHVEAWYKQYASDGLVVVGVHTPEFAFEHVVSNVQGAAQQLGVTYPIAVDDNDITWSTYDNEYWPAEYLVDATGMLRHVDFGEGEYGRTESLIRQLLVDANPGLKLPAPTDLPDRTPTAPTNPETYLGYSRLQYLVGATPVMDAPAVYKFPSFITPEEYALSGSWTIGSEEATAGADARLELDFEAHDVYLVLGGSGTVAVSLNGKAVTTVDVSGIPGLYTLVSGSSESSGVLLLTVSPGVEAYDFTFG